MDGAFRAFFRQIIDVSAFGTLRWMQRSERFADGKPSIFAPPPRTVSAQAVAVDVRVCLAETFEAIAFIRGH